MKRFKSSNVGCDRAPTRIVARHHGRFVTSLVAVLALAASPLDAVFVPGEGGSIPDIAPFEALPNQIGGLRVDQCDRENIIWGNGTRAVLDLSFLPPSTHGAAGYRLQRSLDGVTSWESLQWNEGFLDTVSDTQDNFSFNPPGDGFYRLLVLGGPKSGYTSNAVSVSLPLVETRFAGWGLDQGMFITGVMSPWVGCGMTASFHVRKLSDDSVVEGGLTYQWYRVNPMTSEMVMIPGATGLTYATTEADVGGYHLICRATGDGTTVGGVIQIGASQSIRITNNSFASNVSETGFRLNLFKSVPSLTASDLTLSYWDGAATVHVPITGVTPVGGNAVFDVAAAIPAGAGDLWLANDSDTWALGEEMTFMPGMPPHFMQQLKITLPAAGFDDWIAAHPGIPEGSRGPLDRNGPLALQNLTAYAMGLDPMSASGADLPRVATLDPAAGTLHLIYRRAKNLGDVTLVPRFSLNLASWGNANVQSQTVIEDGGDWERVDAVISFEPGPRVFIILAAETVP
jgi:hypothetical protein